MQRESVSHVDRAKFDGKTGAARGSFYVFKLGVLCVLEVVSMALTVPSGGAWTAIGKVSSYYRPNTEMRGVGAASGAAFGLRIQPNGDVEASATGGLNDVWSSGQIIYTTTYTDV